MIDLTEMQRLINHPDANALGLSIQVRPYDSAHPFVEMICTDGGAHYLGHGATADRKSVVSGKVWPVRVDSGGRTTAYCMRISYWSSDVCSSDLPLGIVRLLASLFLMGMFIAFQIGG